MSTPAWAAMEELYNTFDAFKTFVWWAGFLCDGEDKLVVLNDLINEFIDLHAATQTFVCMYIEGGEVFKLRDAREVLGR